MWELTEIISSKFNREGSQKCSARSVLMVIQNNISNTSSIFQIDKFHKTSVSMRCNNRKFSHRLSLKHHLPVEQYRKFDLCFIFSLLAFDFSLVLLMRSRAFD